MAGHDQLKEHDHSTLVFNVKIEINLTAIIFDKDGVESVLFPGILTPKMMHATAVDVAAGLVINLVHCMRRRKQLVKYISHGRRRLLISRVILISGLLKSTRFLYEYIMPT